MTHNYGQSYHIEKLPQPIWNHSPVTHVPQGLEGNQLAQFELPVLVILSVNNIFSLSDPAGNKNDSYQVNMSLYRVTSKDFLLLTSQIFINTKWNHVSSCDVLSEFSELDIGGLCWTPAEEENSQTSTSDSVSHMSIMLSLPSFTTPSLLSLQ